MNTRSLNDLILPHLNCPTGDCSFCRDRAAAIIAIVRQHQAEQPQRCKHDVWPYDHCYACEKEAKASGYSGYLPKDVYDSAMADIKAVNEGQQREISDNEASYRMALEHIREVWAGSECGVPVHAQEAYAINLCKEMYQEAVDALAGRTPVPVANGQPVGITDDIELDKLRQLNRDRTKGSFTVHVGGSDPVYIARDDGHYIAKIMTSYGYTQDAHFFAAAPRMMAFIEAQYEEKKRLLACVEEYEALEHEKNELETENEILVQRVAKAETQLERESGEEKK